MSDRRLLLTIVLVVVGWAVLVVGGAIYLSRHFPRRSGVEGGLARGPAGKPLPAAKQAITCKQLEPALLKYARSNTVEAYRQCGVHDARWDKQAEAFLESLAQRFVGTEQAPSTQAVAQQAQALLRLGCTDPLVLDRCGRMIGLAGHPEQGRPYIVRGLAGLRKGKYPALCLAWAYRDMAWLEGETGRGLERSDFKWRPLAIAALADAADKRNFGPQGQRVYYWLLADLMEDDFRRSQAVIVETLRSRPNTDPWVLNMAYGKHRRDYAWFRRGTSWAQDVKPDDWKAFEEAAQDAQGYYEKAYREHPEYPETAGALLDMAKALGEDTTREWFDRAIAAQFDYMPAYYSRISALQPRWGGSHRALLDFGEECLRTGRFDTLVPKIYYEAVLTISEHDREEAIWQEPEVWTNLRQWCEGAIAAEGARGTPTTAAAQARSRAQLQEVRTIYALLGYRTGHYADARRQAAALGGRLHKPTIDAQWAERCEFVAGRIYALGGARQEEVQKAEKLFDEARLPEALAAYKALLAGAPDPQTRFYVRDRLQVLQWEQQFQANQWVSLRPTPDMVGWNVWQGTYKPLPEGNGFVMRPGERYGIMACMMRPGRWYELRCNVEFPRRPVKGIEAGFVVDIPMVASPYYDTCRIIREPAECVYGPSWDQWKQHALPAVPQKCRLRLVQCDDRLTMYLNNETVLQDQQLAERDFRHKGPHYVALGGEVWPEPEQPVIYRNIEIHKMGVQAVGSTN